MAGGKLSLAIGAGQDVNTGSDVGGTRPVAFAAIAVCASAKSQGRIGMRYGTPGLRLRTVVGIAARGGNIKMVLRRGDTNKDYANKG